MSSDNTPWPRDATGHVATSSTPQRQRANEVMADAEVAAAERMLAAAELEFAAAQAEQQQWAAAANDVSV